MTNMPKASKVIVILSTAAALLAGGCSQSLAPPFPDIAPFPTKVLSKDEQTKAIDAMTAAKDAQNKENAATVQNAVARSSYTQ